MSEHCTCPIHVPGKWDHHRMNMSFLDTLRRTCSDQDSFTNKDAYIIYVSYHYHPWSWNSTFTGLDDPFMQMNVRNTLCHAAHDGLLIRLAPGRYAFPL
jgi:hypothetical protein